MSVNDIILDLCCGENFRFEDATHFLDFREIVVSDNKIFILHNVLNIPYPFEENSVSKVYFCHAIEHFTRYDAFSILEEIYRILKEDGILHIETPNIYKVMEFLVCEGKQDLESEDIPAWGKPSKAIWSEPLYKGALHLYGYSWITLERILGEVGFEIMSHNDYDTYALIVEVKKCNNQK